jgi:S1-C subfamily serine protease
VWRHPSELGARAGGPAGALPTPAPASATDQRAGSKTFALVAVAGLILVAATAVSIRFLSDRSPRFASARGVATTLGSSTPAFATTAALAKPTAGLTLVATVRNIERRSQAVAVDEATLVTTVAAVTGSTALAALLPDGRRVTASLLGMDRDAGVAVVGLSSGTAAPDTMGTAVLLRAGDELWMAGHEEPGTITATGRHANLPDGTRIHHVIRLDFDDEKAKEGQALINRNGKVVGLCTRDATGAVVGIPIDLATSAATSFRTNKKLVVPWLGVTGGDKAPDTDDGVPDGGALITSVSQGGPAQQAGLRAGDVVVAFGGMKISSISAFVLAARAHRIGEAVSVSVVRDGQPQALVLTLGEKP